VTNKELASKFSLLGKLLELHGESSFQARAYTNAYLSIRKWPAPLAGMTAPELHEMKGVGKAIQAKIRELLDTGEMQSLNNYLEKTPPGIIELLSIKGFGPKKVKLVWEALGIESTGELLYAITENRLVDLKGFGAKTQETLKQQLEYHLESKGSFHYATASALSTELLALLEQKFPKYRFDLSGEMARKCDIIRSLTLLTNADSKLISGFLESNEDCVKVEQNWYYKSIKLEFHYPKKAAYFYELARHNSESTFWDELGLPSGDYSSEEMVFEQNDNIYIIPEFREKENIKELAHYPGAQNIITREAIRGCIHNHSTYSDGVNTLEEMLAASMDKGHEYFVITDHSKSAFYANGLTEERLLQQLDEIRLLDQKENDIRFFSGIESDILNDGSLDYADEVLGELDVIIASVHSNLKMDQAKATQRLITAIENPYTSILGHPTGRLLLSRKGYPIDHEKIIDACAANQVVIELNANPNRLDMDWRWINYAISKEVMISINPDAHSIKGIDDIAYGVACARKAGLPVSYCLNAMDIDEFEEWLEDQHAKR